MTSGDLGYSVEVRGLDEQLRKLERMGDFAQGPLVAAMNWSLSAVEREAKQLAPVGVTGILRSSIGHEVRYAVGTDVRGVVGASAPYAAAVELGASAHYPPVSNIAYWVDRKLQVRDGQEIWQIAVAISRKIGAHGTKARPFLMPAYEARQAAIVERFRQALEQVTKALVVRMGAR